MIETGRLTLRPLTLDDAPFILGLLNDESFLRFIGDKGVRTIDDARDYLTNGPIASYARHGFGLLLVELKPDRVPAGICGLLKRDALPDADIGFALAAEFRGRGLAREAAMATLEYARDVVGLTRVIAIASPGNLVSIGLLEGLGMRSEGTVRLDPESPEVVLLSRDFNTS